MNLQDVLDVIGTLTPFLIAFLFYLTLNAGVGELQKISRQLLISNHYRQQETAFRERLVESTSKPSSPIVGIGGRK